MIMSIARTAGMEKLLQNVMRMESYSAGRMGMELRAAGMAIIGVIMQLYFGL